MIFGKIKSGRLSLGDQVWKIKFEVGAWIREYLIASGRVGVGWLLCGSRVGWLVAFDIFLGMKIAREELNENQARAREPSTSVMYAAGLLFWR